MPVRRSRTFWTAFYTACQAWWWRAILFTNLAVYAILWLTHSVTGVASTIWGLVWLAGLAAVWIRALSLYRKARVQEHD